MVPAGVVAPNTGEASLTYPTLTVTVEVPVKAGVPPSLTVTTITLYATPVVSRSIAVARSSWPAVEPEKVKKPVIRFTVIRN